MKSSAIVFALILGSTALASAQVPAPAPPPPVTPAADLPSPPADYTYSTGGRRDPFMTLTRTVTTVTTSGGGPTRPGLEFIAVDDLSVKGIVLSNGSYVAMVAGPGGKSQTYTVKAGSRLLDGMVQSITADAVVILQQVSDPLSLQKQRQVRKPLRTQEEGK